MLTQRWIQLCAIALICILVETQVSSAQGTIISAGGPVHRSMAGASTAAPTSALSALYWNPATISGLGGTEVEVGLDILFIDHEVSSVLGGNSGTTEAEAGTFPLPNVGFVYHTGNPAVTFGLGINAVAGFKTNLPVDPNNPVLAPVPSGGLGRVSSEASFLQLSPVISLALSDRVSFAVGPTITTAQIGAEPFIFDSANANGTYSPGRATRYHWGGGVQAGIYYIGENCWHAGASIKSPAWMEEFEFFSEDENGFPRTLTLDLDLPLILSVGLAYSGIEDWILALDARLIDYSNADGWGDPAQFDATGRLQGLDYSSVMAMAVGAQKRWSDRLYLRGGYSYNQNPVSNSEAFFNIATPLIYQHMIATGASYHLNEKLAINMGYSHNFDVSRTGPVVLPGGAVPGSSFTNRLQTHYLSFGIVMRQ